MPKDVHSEKVKGSFKNGILEVRLLKTEEAKAKESKTKAEDLITRVVYVQNVTAQEIQTTLRQYLSPRGQLNVNVHVGEKGVAWRRLRLALRGGGGRR